MGKGIGQPASLTGTDRGPATTGDHAALLAHMLKIACDLLTWEASDHRTNRIPPAKLRVKTAEKLERFVTRAKAAIRKAEAA